MTPVNPAPQEGTDMTTATESHLPTTGPDAWAAAREAALAARNSHRAFIAIADEARRIDTDVEPGERRVPLAGVPFAVKDNIDTDDLPTSAGTPVLRESVPARDAAVVARLRRAGAELVGKTNLHELAFGITSDNAAFGTVLNPCDPQHSPGGSSGGSAVAVALGVVPFALGTDTGGSARVPAAHCGIVGFRPSTGRYPAEGVARLSSTRDTVGVLAGCVDDVRLVDATIVGSHLRLPTPSLGAVRLGVPVRGFVDDVDPVVAAAFETATSRLAAAGAVLVEADFSDALRLDAECGFPLVFAEAPRELTRYLEALGTGLTFDDLVAGAASPDVAQTLAAIATDPVPVAAYVEALTVRGRLLDTYAALFAAHGLDALIYPTVPFPAPPLTDRESTQLLGEQVPLFPATIRNVAPSSVAGTPSISLPCPADGVLPIGLSVEGPPHRDARVLALARAVESVLTPEVRPRMPWPAMP
jgi:mandelamide amidase